MVERIRVHIFSTRITTMQRIFPTSPYRLSLVASSRW